MRAYPNVKKMETAAAAATRLLKNVNVQTYIEERSKQLDDQNIADMKEVKRFWTNTMRDVEEPTRDRIKASECIARSEGAFLEKVEHSGTVDINSKVKLIDKYLDE
jgi:phage terminase small subunit